MDVAFAADRRGVAQPGRDLFDSGPKIALSLGSAVEAFKFGESHCRENRPCPRAEIFRGDIPSRNFLEVFINVGRCDVPTISFFIDVLEEFLARELLASPDDLRDAAIPHAQRPLLAALAGEPKPNLVSVDSDVAILQRRKTVGVVLPCRVVVSYAD